MLPLFPCTDLSVWPRACCKQQQLLWSAWCIFLRSSTCPHMHFGGSGEKSWAGLWVSSMAVLTTFESVSFAPVAKADGAIRAGSVPVAPSWQHGWGVTPLLWRCGGCTWPRRAPLPCHSHSLSYFPGCLSSEWQNSTSAAEQLCAAPEEQQPCGGHVLFPS